MESEKLRGVVWLELKRRISRRRFLEAVFSGLLAGCAKVSGLVPAAQETPSQTAPSSTPGEAATHTPTVESTQTPLTEATPTPTATPNPTATPTPSPPSAGDGVPVIGIVAHHLYAQVYGTHVDGQIDAYRHAVALAGGAPILIPLGLQERQWRAIYEVLDGILFPGGVDVDPTHYGESPHPNLGAVDPALDRVELTLAKWALADDLPVLGICRGAQLINVAAGGTLIQDIPSEWPGALPHVTSRVDAHVVLIRDGMQLREIMGVAECTTNSRHHQAAEALAEGFFVSATAPDGVVEAIECRDARFCVGVQWHPENLVDGDPRMLKIFEAFVEAAGEG